MEGIPLIWSRALHNSHAQSRPCNDKRYKNKKSAFKRLLRKNWQQRYTPTHHQIVAPPTHLKMDANKVHRKVRRKQAQFLKQEPDTDLRFQEDPTKHIFIGNGGLKNGVPREILENILTTRIPKRHVEQLYLPSGKDYALATFTNSTTASECLDSLNGVCVQNVCDFPKTLPPALLNGPPVNLFMSYIDKIPENILMCDMPDDNKLPPGLLLLEDFVSIEEEEELLKIFSFISDDKTKPELTTEATDVISPAKPLAMTEEYTPPTAALKHRQVMHFGYEFLYGSNLVDPSRPLPGGLPVITRPLLDRMMERQLTTERPDQLTVNKYSPGSGTHKHSLSIYIHTLIIKIF